MQDIRTFAYPVEAGDDFEGIIALKAPLFGVAAYKFTYVGHIFLCHVFYFCVSLSTKRGPEFVLKLEIGICVQKQVMLSLYWGILNSEY